MRRYRLTLGAVALREAANAKMSERQQKQAAQPGISNFIVITEFPVSSQSCSIPRRVPESSVTTSCFRLAVMECQT